MAPEFCPSCGRRREGTFRFCRGCGLDFDAMPAAGPAPLPAIQSASGSQPAPAQPQTQQLANAAKTVQNVNVGMSLGGLVGLVLGIVIPGWFDFGIMTEPGLAILVPFTIGPIVGTILGQRAALILMGR